MDEESGIFEERRIRLRLTSHRDTSGFTDYLSLCRDHIWPGLEEKGGQVICLLQGVLGSPTEELLQMTWFPDLLTWRQAQPAQVGRGSDLVESEKVRLFRPITSRPKDPLPVEDRRPFYVDRRFFIRNRHLEECADLSENGVWPLYEAWGCRVLGLFTTVAATEIQEVLLITGYRSIAHWEETRAIRKPRPEGIDEDIWESGIDAVMRRATLTMRSTASMMRGVYLCCDT